MMAAETDRLLATAKQLFTVKRLAARLCDKNSLTKQFALNGTTHCTTSHHCRRSPHLQLHDRVQVGDPKLLCLAGNSLDRQRPRLPQDSEPHPSKQEILLATTARPSVRVVASNHSNSRLEFPPEQNLTCILIDGNNAQLLRLVDERDKARHGRRVGVQRDQRF